MMLVCNFRYEFEASAPGNHLEDVESLVHMAFNLETLDLGK
jgi:hypothetical protein